MTIFLIIGYDNKGNLGEWTFGEPNMELGLDFLTNLTNKGWILSEIKLLGSTKKGIVKPFPFPTIGKTAVPTRT